MLLFFSLIFYGWGEGEFLVIVLLSIVANYVFGLLIGNSDSKDRKKWWLIAACAFNIGLLLYYKYANFFADNYNFTAKVLGFSPMFWEKIILPLGISFFTFHGMSYIIDLYREKFEAQRNPFKLALYITFFPQLIAGPIIRYKDIYQEIDNRQENYQLFAEGAKRFIVGLAKKVLIANMLGRIPAYVYEMPVEEYNGLFNWLALVAGGLQMYFDFSGYSDMAIGLAKMFGFNFKENFNYPYISRSMKEFWTRWHISLSTWFRDYLYIPLGGNQKGAFRMYINLWIVFLLNGLWHGANWTFIMFGVIHGFFLTIERLGVSKLLKHIPRPFTSIYVFLVFSSSIVLFSMKDLSQAGLFFSKLFDFNHINIYSRGFLYMTVEWFFILLLAIVLCTPVVEYIYKKIPANRTRNIVTNIILLLLLVISAGEVANGSYNPFIYFRF